jgi:hypothetical protein
MLNAFCVALVRRTFICSAIIAMLACSVPVGAQTQPSPKPTLKISPVSGGTLIVYVSNHSPTCVYVSVAGATFYLPWVWMPGARFIRPNDTNIRYQIVFPKFNVPHPYEAKVEAIFMQNPDCTGSKLRTIEAVNKQIWPLVGMGFEGKAAANLRGDKPHNFSVQIVAHNPHK